MTADQGLGRHVRSVSGITLVSRVLGLVRDVLTARLFGDTAVGSAFAAALMIPNVFRRLFGEGAIAAAFVPAYARLLGEDRQRADALASATVAGLAVVTGAITLAGELLLAWLLARAGDGPRAESLRLIMVTLPFMPLICAAAILGGMLQVHGRFGPWAAAPIVLNVCMIAVAAPALVTGRDAASWAAGIAGAVVVSGVIQVAWSVWSLRGTVRWTRRLHPARAEARAMLVRLGPALVGLGTLQINSLIDTALAMFPVWVGPTIGGLSYPLDEASNSVLFYAQRLYQFPLGVFGIAVATVVFPALSRVSADPVLFAQTLRRGVAMSLFIGLPATAGLAIVGTDLARVVLGGFGQGFTDAGAARAGGVLMGYAGAVWAYSLNQMLVRAFYARGDTRTPMVVAIGAMLLNLTLNLALIWPLREAGLAWSTAISAVAQCAVLALRLRPGLGGEPLIDTFVRRSVLRTATLTAAMAGAVAISRVLPAAGDAAWPIGRLSVGVLVGAAAYLGGAWLLRAPELRSLLARGRDA